jgi:hypothetical protein
MRRMGTWLSLTAFVLVLIGSGIQGTAGTAPRRNWTRFEGTDDLAFDPGIPLAALLETLLQTVSCVATPPTGDPFVPCPEGSRVRVRGLTGQSLIQTTDPRFSGVATFVANGNLDPEYSGPVQGRWRLDDLASGNGAWEGIWHGRRTLVPGPAGNVWIGELQLVGSGSGSVAGLRVQARETIFTYTPLPFPYEALLYFGFPGVCPSGVCPPEAFIEGSIY